MDLNLLVVFDALMRHRSVSKAAAEVGVSPSGVSHALRRLRHHYHDHLLVRRQGAMEPTPRALALAAPVRSALAVLHRALDAKFDPMAYKREFKVGLVDVQPVDLLTAVLSLLAAKSPHISMSAFSLSAAAAEGQLLSSDIDLIIGNGGRARRHVIKETLLSEQVVVVARQNHPLLSNGLTLKQYWELEHVRVPHLDDWLDGRLRGKRRARRFSVVASQSAEVPMLVARSNAIATMFQGPAERAAELLPLRIHLLPFKPLAFDVAMTWHAHSRPDASHRWLRGMFLEAARSMSHYNRNH
jgi:DNA-binding transcriptional LysR family regulator